MPAASRFRCFAPLYLGELCVIKQFNCARLVIMGDAVVGFDRMEKVTMALEVGKTADFILICDDEGNRTTLRRLKPSQRTPEAMQA